MPRYNLDYSKAKIYKLVNDVDDYIYVGSCCSDLAKRLYQHKQDSHKTPSRRVYKHILDIGGVEHMRIILVEKCADNVNSNDELCKREQYFLDKYIKEIGREKCLNTVAAHGGVPFSGENATYEEYLERKKEYRKVNAEVIQKKKKIYNDNHKAHQQEVDKKWYGENKEACAVKWQDYKEKKGDQIRERQRIHNNSRYICHVCHKDLSLGNRSAHDKTVDHIRNFIEY